MFKRILFIIILFSPAFFVFPKDNDTIRVLAIGNSFSEDAVENYLYDIGKAGNVVFIIGNMYIGGCSLHMHWNNANNDSRAYSYRKINAQGVKTTTTNAKLSEVIAGEPWDYITFQQVSSDSGIYGTYFPYLTNLLNYVKTKATNPNVRYALHMTWAYAGNSTHSGFTSYNKNQMQMYNAIVDAANRAAEAVGISIVIPSGTAIQNARTTYLGDTFCRDGYHLDMGIGRYTAACTWYEKLIGNSVAGNAYAPSSLSGINVEIAQKAAHYAVQTPKSITDMQEDYPLVDYETYLLAAPVNIDFGSSASARPWNNLASVNKGSSINGLSDMNGKITPIMIEITDAFGGVNTNGPTTAINLQGWNITKEATGDSFFGNAGESFGGKVIETGSFLVSKLNVNQQYSFNFFSSRIASDNRETSFKVEGITEQTFYVNSASNTTNLVTVETVTPKTDGTIKITVGAGPNNNQSNKFFYINALQIVPGESTSFQNSYHYDLNNIYLYPNPVNNVLNFSQEISSAKIYSVSGECLLSATKTNSMNIESLTKGIYLVQILDNQGNSYTYKIIQKRF